MKQNTNIFLSEQKELGLPELKYDLLLADGPYPFLFTCTDSEESQTYLVVCHTSNAEKTEYVMVPRSLTTIQSLLKNDLTIRDALVQGAGHVYLVTFPRGGGEPQARYLTLEQLPPNCLPTPGYYMDPEEGEFEEELAILEERVRINHLHCIARRCCKTTLSIQPFSMESLSWTSVGKLSSYTVVRSASWQKKQPV